MREPTDELVLAYDYGRHGWSALYVIHRQGQHVIRITHIFGNPVTELMNLCQGLLDNSAVLVVLPDEPGTTEISLTPDAAQHHVMRLTISDEGKPVFDGLMKRKQLLVMLLGELWKVRRLMEEPSYQKDRTLFPSESLEILNRDWDKGPLGPSCLK